MHTIRKLVEKYGKYVIWAVVISFVLGALVIFSPVAFNPSARNVKDEDVVLVVNGKKIGKFEYERAYQEILNEQRQFNPEIEKTLEGPDGAYRQLQWRAQAIERLIEKTIKEQESRKRGISVPAKKLDERYKQEYENFLLMLRHRYGIDEKELARILKERGSSLPAYQRQIRDQVAAPAQRRSPRGSRRRTHRSHRSSAHRVHRAEQDALYQRSLRVSATFDRRAASIL
jgi:hypothetical protein